MLLFLLAALVVFLFLPVLTWAVVEGSWRHRWTVVEESPANPGVQPGGAFRDAAAHAVNARVRRSRAPWLLHLAGLSCWALGQMAIPGFLAFLLGLALIGQLAQQRDPIPLVFLASFFPGTWCAWLVWDAGSSLLRGVAAEADRATRLAAWIVGSYNVLILVGLAVRLRSGHHDDFLEACGAYAVLSITHALSVRAVFLRHRAAFPL